MHRPTDLHDLETSEVKTNMFRNNLNERGTDGFSEDTGVTDPCDLSRNEEEPEKTWVQKKCPIGNEMNDTKSSKVGVVKSILPKRDFNDSGFYSSCNDTGINDQTGPNTVVNDETVVTENENELSNFVVPKNEFNDSGIDICDISATCTRTRDEGETGISRNKQNKDRYVLEEGKSKTNISRSIDVGSSDHNVSEDERNSLVFGELSVAQVPVYTTTTGEISDIDYPERYKTLKTELAYFLSIQQGSISLTESTSSEMASEFEVENIQDESEVKNVCGARNFAGNDEMEIQEEAEKEFINYHLAQQDNDVSEWSSFFALVTLMILSVYTVTGLERVLLLQMVRKYLYRFVCLYEEFGPRKPPMKAELVKTYSRSGSNYSLPRSFSEWMHSDFRNVSYMYPCNRDHPCFRDHSFENSIRLSSLRAALNNNTDNMHGRVPNLNPLLPHHRQHDARNNNYISDLGQIYNHSPRHVSLIPSRFVSLYHEQYLHRRLRLGCFLDQRFNTWCLCLTDQSITRIQQVPQRYQYHTHVSGGIVNCNRRCLRVFLDDRHLTSSLCLTDDSIHRIYRDGSDRVRSCTYRDLATHSDIQFERPNGTIENQHGPRNRQVSERSSRYMTCRLDGSSTMLNFKVDHRYGCASLRLTGESYQRLMEQMSPREIPSSGFNFLQSGNGRRFERPNGTIENENGTRNRQVSERSSRYTTCTLDGFSTMLNFEVDHRYGCASLRLTGESYQRLMEQMSPREIPSSGFNFLQTGSGRRIEIQNGDDGFVGNNSRNICEQQRGIFTRIRDNAVGRQSNDRNNTKMSTTAGIGNDGNNGLVAKDKTDIVDVIYRGRIITAIVVEEGSLMQDIIQKVNYAVSEHRSKLCTFYTVQRTERGELMIHDDY